MKFVIRLIGVSVALSVLGCGQPAEKPAAPSSAPAANDMNKNPNLKNMPPEARQQLLDKMGGATH
jgi:hypothetical protein